MGKVEENKKKKLDAILENAYHLFLNKGFEKTIVNDIVKSAGVAKGTFYLYFKDKYEVRDLLIAKTAEKIFRKAHNALQQEHIPLVEDQIVFIVGYVLQIMVENPLILRFVSKNLSWGIFQNAITKSQGQEEGIYDLFYSSILACTDQRFHAPDTMLFLIVELASSTSYSTILDKNPMSFEELKPFLNEAIRAIISLHKVT